MIQAKQILNTSTNTTGAASLDNIAGACFQASIIGTGTISCTVTIQCSLDATNWLNLGTITLSGSGSATDGFTTTAPWVAYRAVTSGVTGTVSSIVVNMSEES